MKFLILSTATGQGHNSAALAVAEALRAKGCTAHTLDVLKLQNKEISQRVAKLYGKTTVNSPRFFGFLYHLGELISSPQGRSPIYAANTLYARQLAYLVRRLQPDVLICTHIFSAQAVTCLQEHYGLRIPAVGIATDYTCIPFWEESNLTSYIIPSKYQITDFATKGIPKEKLKPLGIPVAAAFSDSRPKEEARRWFQMRAEHMYLVMGGSMGYGKMKELAIALTAADPHAQVVALCGHNQRLFQALSHIDRVIPMEYTNHVSLLMDAADVVLTKPGGLSSTEALTKRVPTVLTRPIPGCEDRNAEYLASVGAAAFSENIERAAKEACRLACYPAAAQKMIAAHKRFIPANAAERIADYLIEVGRTGQNSLQETVQKGETI
ncbi:MAG: glycosyltransferase [Oscillospiraceae bacterium]|nr:glycosyltransferase [Oscillospiraceae bacterium]